MCTYLNKGRSLFCPGNLYKNQEWLPKCSCHLCHGGRAETATTLNEPAKDLNSWQSYLVKIKRFWFIEKLSSIAIWSNLPLPKLRKTLDCFNHIFKQKFYSLGSLFCYTAVEIDYFNSKDRQTDSWQLGHVTRRHYVALRLVRGKGVSFCSISQFSNCGRGLCPFPAAMTFWQNGRCPKRQVLHVL